MHCANSAPDNRFGDLAMTVPVSDEQRDALITQIALATLSGMPKTSLLTRFLRMDMESATLILQDIRSAEDLRDRYLTWREDASDMDLTAGLIGAIILKEWPRGGPDMASEALERHLLIPESVSAATFIPFDDPEADPNLVVSLAARSLAHHVLSGPRLAGFVLGRSNGDMIAATTRPDGRMGLPGGKLDPGETISEAAIREAREEGWDAEFWDPRRLHVELIENHLCVWFENPGRMMMLDLFKEMGRITPFEARPDQLMRFGLGNQNAIPKMQPVMIAEMSEAHAIGM